MTYEHSDSRKPPHNPQVRESQNIVKQKPKTSDLRANSEVGKETNPRPVTAAIQASRNSSASANGSK